MIYHSILPRDHTHSPFFSLHHLELNDQKHLTDEQMEFLEKFFKENPWADQAQLDAIVKATGFNETMVKVSGSICEEEEEDERDIHFHSDLRRTTTNEMEQCL